MRATRFINSLIYWLRDPVDALRLRHNSRCHSIWVAVDPKEETWPGVHSPKEWETEVFPPSAKSSVRVWVGMFMTKTCRFNETKRGTL